MLENSILGRNYVSLVYGNSTEIVTFLMNSLLMATKKIIDEILPGIQTVIEGKNMILSEQTLDDMYYLLNSLKSRQALN